MTASRWETATVWAIGVLLAVGALHGISVGVVMAWLDSWDEAGRSAVLLHLAILAAVAAAWVAGTVYFGPQARSAAALQWWPSGAEPSRFRYRYGAITVPLSLLTAGALVLVPLWPGGGAWLAGAGYAILLQVFSWIAFGGQLADATSWLRALAGALAAAALAALAVSARDWVVAGATTVFAVAWLCSRRPRRAARRVGNEPPRWLLIQAAQNRWALHAGLLTMDASVVRQVRERWTARATGRPVVLPRAMPEPLNRAGIILSRQLGAMVVTIAVTTYLASSVVTVWSMSAAVMIVLLGIGRLGALTAPVGDRWAQARSLRRSYASMSGWTVLAPAVGAAWVLAGCGAMALQPALAHLVVLALVPPAMVWRRHRSRQGRVQGWASSPMGAIPLEQVDAALGGWDVIGIAVLLVGLI